MIRKILLFALIPGLFFLVFFWNKEESKDLNINPTIPNTTVLSGHQVAKVTLPVEKAQDITPTTDTPTTESESDEPEIIDDQKIYGQKSPYLLAKREGDFWVVQGDILVDPNAFLEEASETDIKIAEVPGVAYWPNGVIPYVIEDGVDHDLVKNALNEINASTNARFVDRSSELDFVSFRSIPNQACLSYLGRKGGEQEILLHSSCTKGQIQHEMLHALGFVHEHSREDRDLYIHINWDNIEPPRKNQFQKLPKAISEPVDSPFDFGSILLYDSYSFSVNKEATILKKDGSKFGVNRVKLSDGDIARVNLLYPASS